MDTNDLIEELITDVPSGAEVILAETPSGEYIFIYSLGDKVAGSKIIGGQFIKAGGHCQKAF